MKKPIVKQPIFNKPIVKKPIVKKPIIKKPIVKHTITKVRSRIIELLSNFRVIEVNLRNHVFKQFFHSIFAIFFF